MADARMCDNCKKVFGNNEKVDKPQYRLFVRNKEYDYCYEDKRGISEYKEPELCPECVEALFNLIRNDKKFANIDK